MPAPRLNAAAVELLRNTAEAERECGDEKVAIALEALLDWHDDAGRDSDEPRPRRRRR